MITLVVVVTTYAWYTSQTRVYTSPTYVYTASGGNTEIIAESSPEFDTYSGQTGKDNGDDAPYYATKQITANFVPLQTNSALQINFTSINILKVGGDEVDSGDDDDVIPSFTWRVVYDNHEYMPDENNFAYYEANDERNYIIFDDSETITFAIKIIYLSESDYLAYEAGNYSNISGFSYSGYEYMRARFTVTIEIGIDVLVLE